MRRNFTMRKLARRYRKPSELLLVPMIDIFTVLVTFLLMTAVFSRTVIMELKLPAPGAESAEPPKGLVLEVVLRKTGLTVQDRGSGVLKSLPRAAGPRQEAGQGCKAARHKMIIIRSVSAAAPAGIPRAVQLAFGISRPGAKLP